MGGSYNAKIFRDFKKKASFEKLLGYHVCEQCGQLVPNGFSRKHKELCRKVGRFWRR